MPDRVKRPTIKDVAQAADVAISTVSLVMNRKGYVSDDTRERVLQAARRLGYVPKQAARQLAAQETGNIGFVLIDDHFSRSEPFYTRVFLGTEFEARHQERYILLATIPRDYTPGTHAPRFLKQHSIDGLIVAGKVPTAFLDEVDAFDLPTVLIDFETGRHPAIVIDNRGGARAAVEHLVDRGHARIGFLGADMSHPSLQARFEGYRSALQAASLSADDAWVVVSDGLLPVLSTGTALAEELLRRPDLPTAIFCGNDALARGALRTFRRAGLRIPDDIALVGFDDVEGAAHTSPALTTVRVYKEQLGELGLRYLGELLAQGKGASASPQYQRIPHTITVPTELVIRSSS